MKILLATHHLFAQTGSEIFTYEIARLLKTQGHDVYVYSKFIGGEILRLSDYQVHLVTNLDLVKSLHFDICHIHHNISFYEVNHFFPHVPKFFLAHGVTPFLEQPPLTECAIDTYGAVSEEVAEHLVTFGIPREKIMIFRNLIDESRFTKMSEIQARIQHGLILTRKIDQSTRDVITEACSELSIDLINPGETSNFTLPQLYNSVDLVFSSGRGVIEAMMCGRIPVVFDFLGGDGVVDVNNMLQIATHNFSGRKYSIKYSPEQLVSLIRNINTHDYSHIREKAIKLFGNQRATDELETVYSMTIQNRNRTKSSYQEVTISKHICHVITETHNYTMHVSKINIENNEKTNLRLIGDMQEIIANLRCELEDTKKRLRTEINDLYGQLSDIRKLKEEMDKKNFSLSEDLKRIQSSKTYWLWQKLNSQKKLIKKYFNLSHLFKNI